MRDSVAEVEYGDTLPMHMRWYPSHIVIRHVPPVAFWRECDGEPELCTYSMEWVNAVKAWPDALITFEVEDDGMRVEMEMTAADMASASNVQAWTRSALDDMNSPDWM